MKWPYIDFMGKRYVLFVISAVLVAISLGGLFVNGLNLGIEFEGGTLITLNGAKADIATVRSAATEAGVKDPLPQTTSSGYIVRSTETSTTAAETAATKLASALKVDENNIQVSTIGPEWGSNITDAAIIALVVSIIAILAYISIRFEYKMAIIGVVALFHDVIITLGLYALLNRELTPNTLAALLTIMGYSLYDTIVVFHRIRENTVGLSKKTFLEMTNDSLNQILARWVNTGMASVIPVLSLLLFGGSTLGDFAFALLVGLIAGAYSSVALASPLYAMWKEQEPKYRALAKRFAK